MSDDGQVRTADHEPRWRVIAGRVLTALAFLLLLYAMVTPNQLSKLSPWAFLRIPVEALIGVALVLVLPPRPRKAVAIVGGVLLGLVAIFKAFDFGFYSAFDRGFDPMYDWDFLGPAVSIVREGFGQTGAVIAVIVAVLVAVGLLVLMVFAALRVTRLTVAHRTGAIRTLAVLSVIWVFCAAFGFPVASRSAAGYTYLQTRQVTHNIADARSFKDEVAVDAFRSSSDLLNGLRGKDVLFTFIESYGKVAISDPAIAPGVNSVLANGTTALRNAGFGVRSAFLTSPTFGGGSWLAHSTFQSGVWISNQHRYDSLVAGDRFTFSHAFKKSGWRTVGDLPENMYDWPEGKFYDYDKLYDSRNVGYKGPKYFYAQMPDQYTMSAFQRLERTPGHAPLMAEIDLVTSHTPWAPLPTMVDWDKVGDGSIFGPQPAAAKQPNDVWPDQGKIKAAYGQSIQYSLTTLIEYLQRHGDDNLVLVFLGDHQPQPIVSGEGASHDVPITLVAKDPAVLDRIAGWGWEDNLRPSDHAPVWPMSAFRDRFFTAFGPTTPPPSTQGIRPPG
ncbi:sulfatase [Actinocrispum sp. NPDC049592]|uniref:sulfatase n=1 Tax=Actinocrispum sp. NPDC049592 TaxID=3154835 RepID=UPI00343770FC